MGPNPGPVHEERRRTLDALAVLGGCRDSLLPMLPDGRRPDVLRFDRCRRHLFVGDAKDTETPGCRETRRRLSAYASWLRANALVAGSGTLALCHSADHDRERWLAVLEAIADEHGFGRLRARQLLLDDATGLSWIELRLPARSECDQAASRPLASSTRT